MLPRNIKQEVKKNNRKHWLLASVPLALAGCGMVLFVAIDKQPAKAPENSFENKTVQTSTTQQSTLEETETEETVPQDTETETETETTEWDVAEDYTTFKCYVGSSQVSDADGNRVNRSGFYYVQPVQDPLQSKYIIVNVLEYDLRTNESYVVSVSVKTANIPATEVYELTSKKAIAFVNYMRDICPEGHTTYGLQSNYDYWNENVWKPQHSELETNN